MKERLFSAFLLLAFALVDSALPLLLIFLQRFGQEAYLQIKDESLMCATVCSRTRGSDIHRHFYIHMS